MSDIRPVSIDGNHHKTDHRNDKRQVDGCAAEEFQTRVDDLGLDEWEHRAAQDGHDEAGTCKLHVVAHAAQGNTIDGGEHQRHTGRYAHQTVDAVVVGKQDGTCRQGHGTDG